MVLSGTGGGTVSDVPIVGFASARCTCLVSVISLTVTSSAFTPVDRGILEAYSRVKRLQYKQKGGVVIYDRNITSWRMIADKGLDEA